MEVQGVRLEEVKSFKYLGSIISDLGSKPEIVNKIAQASKTTDEMERQNYCLEIKNQTH